MDIQLERLADPFDPKDVEWRVQSCGERDGKVWAKVLAYIANRAVMDRLDEVCGPGNWRNEFREWNAGKDGVLCGISIRVGGEWVTKWDGAENTDIEEVKGGLSSAMKRAAVQWGIGRYLYDLDEGWAEVGPNGQHYAQTKDKKPFRWSPPKLPAWALPQKAQPAAELPKPTENPRAKTAEAIVKAIKAATSEPLVKAAGLMAPGKGEWFKVRDEHSAAVEHAAEKRKLALRLDVVDDYCTKLGYGTVELAMRASQCDITDIDGMTADDAGRLIAALANDIRQKAEDARTVTA